MADVRSRHWGVVVAAASAVLGCSGDSSGAGGGGVTSSGQTLSCASPACCVPLNIDVSKIIVYQADSAIQISVILESPAASTDAWDASVDVSLSWGPRVTCTTAVSSFDQRFFTLACPSLPLDGAPACDSTFTLALSPRTSTYADSVGTQIRCAGKAGARIEFPLLMKCPVCASLSTPAGGEPCEFPGGRCDYSAYLPNGGSGRLPCDCGLNSASGNRTWSCAIP
jgi:hypothetical protein